MSENYSYAVKDMWESEQQYLKDLQFALDTYHAKFPTLPDLPSRLQGQSERIFGNLPQLRDFHHRFVFCICAKSHTHNVVLT